ncbi:MAG: hypothetical protein II882_02680 [Lachnospiraceae bacterium]|nr:hypothetical protein [Lachnospiraceae bacterium]
MGNLIVSQSKPVMHPYYVPELGIHLHTGEELSYFINHHVLLIEESFPDERLFDFLDQLGQTKLSERVRRMKEQGSGLYEILYVLQQELHYYNSSELFAFRSQLEKIARSSPGQRLKTKGDYLYKGGQYYSALRIYNQILGAEGPEPADRALAGRIWTSAGACYAELAHYEEAEQCLVNAYRLNRDPMLPEKIYLLDQLMGKEALPEEILDALTPERLEQFKSNLEKRRQLAIYEGKALEAAALQDKPSDERGEAYLELLYRWKEEYRKNAL